MLTDIRSVLMENKTNAEETVYAELPKAITEYPLTIGNFNTVISGKETVEQFSTLLDSKNHFLQSLIRLPNMHSVRSRSENCQKL